MVRPAFSVCTDARNLAFHSVTAAPKDGTGDGEENQFIVRRTDPILHTNPDSNPAHPTRRRLPRACLGVGVAKPSFNTREPGSSRALDCWMIRRGLFFPATPTILRFPAYAVDRVWGEPSRRSAPRRPSIVHVAFHADGP